MADPVPASDTTVDNADVAYVYTETAAGAFRKAAPSGLKAALDIETTDTPQYAGLNIGHASDTTVTRFSAGVLAVEGNALLDVTDIGSIVQAYDVDTCKLDVPNQVVTGGAEITPLDLGTVSSGTGTLDMGDRPIQYYTNNGAHTLAPGTVQGSIILDIINGASAGTITTSGWTKVSGDSFTTTNSHRFRCHCSLVGSVSLLVVQALQ